MPPGLIQTVFWVARASATAAPGYSFLLGDYATYHFCSGASRQIWSSSYVSASIKNGETRLDGALIDGTTTDRPTTLSVLSVVTTGPVTADALSRDRTATSYSWWGDVAELVIFDRALTTQEIRDVEEFLADRYDIGLVP
jgi:hypothetical protein